MDTPKYGARPRMPRSRRPRRRLFSRASASPGPLIQGLKTERREREVETMHNVHRRQSIDADEREKSVTGS